MGTEQFFAGFIAGTLFVGFLLSWYFSNKQRNMKNHVDRWFNQSEEYRRHIYEDDNHERSKHT